MRATLGLAFSLTAVLLPPQTTETWVRQAPVRSPASATWSVDNFQARPIHWFGGPQSSWGEMSFQLFGINATTTAHLNVFEFPSTSTSTNPGWLLQNVPLFPAMFGPVFTTTFDLSSYSPSKRYLYNLGPIGQDTALRFGALIGLQNPGTVSYGARDANGRGGGPANPALVGPPPPNRSTPFNLSATLLDTVSHFAIPDIGQDSNESAPAAAGNGFAWLGQFSPHVSLPPGQRGAGEIRDVLKDAAHMRTSSTSGTTDTNMVEGVLQFVRDHGLPVAVELRHATLGNQTRAGLTAVSRGSPPGFEWIFEQLEQGHAVQMGVTWAAGSGHWFTVVGAVETLGQQWLYYRDSDDGRDAIKISLVGTSEPTDPFPGFLELEGEASNSVDIAVASSPLPVFGRSCSTGGSVPRLMPASPPVLGNAAFGLLLDNAPPSFNAFFVFGTSNTSWLGSSLPLSLASIGFPGCDLNVAADITVPVLVDPTGAAALTVPVPNVPALVGVRFFAQAAAIGAAPPFLVMTRGIEVTIRG